MEDRYANKINFRISISGLTVMVFDEILSKDYGLGPGISLFIATNISKNIMRKSFSFLLFQVNEESNMKELLLTLRIY